LTDAEIHVLSEGIRGSLATLKDVAGVAGSFVCSRSGQLLAREIPAVFEDGVLSEAGSRLLRMGEAFAATGDDLDMAVVRYGDHRVYLKWISGGLLCVVVVGGVNMPALRMAANLVCRRIAGAVAQAEAATETATVAEPIAESAPGGSALSGSAPALAAPRAYPGMRRFRDRSAQ
jgi:predicted regulator of Ras-like GTPase activity (Roadblock/LC7/MglB family)